ncbi:MAG: hypothetical protein EBS48_00140 [Actinobacteria bacterium]|nr:hypothetical protein [Actinomycetota bacterium]NBR65900.1 hypothetical protein [Actinomycetota bacterium]NBU15419.1 hypothetical protein [Actinomycetota bacterium]
MARRRTFFTSLCAASLLATFGLPVSVDAAMTPPPVRVTVHKLASADGAFEASGQSEWVASIGDRMVPVRTADALEMESGTRIDMPAGAVASVSSLAPADLQRGRLVRGIRKSGLLTNRQLTVVPVQWPGATWKDADRANVDAIVNQLTPWWNAMSARQETLTVRVTSTVDVSVVNSAGECEFAEMANYARKHIDDLGLENKTDNLMVTFTSDTKDCGFAGLGEVGGPTSWTYAAPGYAGVWAHELGHNLGLPHANSCNAGVPLTYLTTCADVEYGNNADVMGSSNLTSFFSPTFLVAASFLPATNTTMWTGVSSTYTLVRADRTDLGVTAVRIPATNPAAGDNTFWLQYNPNRIGQVPAAASPTNGGVAITMEPSANFASNSIAAEGVIGLANSTAYICDLTAPTSDLSSRDLTTDPRLVAGSSWTDPRDRFTVTLVSVDGTSAVVRVDPVASPSVWAYSTVTATPDSSGLTNMTVAWQPNLSNMGSHEPTHWVVDTPEDPSKACLTQIHELSCVLSGVSRSATYTPRVVGTNGSARSAASAAGSTAVPVGPPTFTATFTATDIELKATVTVGDGGGTVQGTPTIEIAGLPPCALTVNAVTVCTFTGLPRRASHVLTARGTNEAGTREKKFTAATLAGVPETPELRGKMAGSDLVVEISPSLMDEANADYYYLQCSVGNKPWSKLLPADIAHVPFGTIKVPAVKGKDTWCYSALIAMGATKQFTSDFGSVKVTKAGKVMAGKLTLSAAADGAKKGLISVKWTAKDSLGKNITVSVNPSKKSCAKKSALSCLVSGLPSGAQIVVRITARGQSGSRSIWKTVIVK